MIIGITDRSLYTTEAVYLSEIDCFLRSKEVDFLIIRDKTIGQESYECMLKEICGRNQENLDKIIVHTYIDVAMKLGLTRVHLPQSYAEKAAQGDFEARGIKISLSLHESFIKSQGPIVAKLMGYLDFFLVSPIYDTSCKPGCSLVDRQILDALKRDYNEKMVLLGGMDAKKIIALKGEGYKHFALRSGISGLIK